MMMMRMMMMRRMCVSISIYCKGKLVHVMCCWGTESKGSVDFVSVMACKALASVLFRSEREREREREREPRCCGVCM